ncbi:hypothetical protein CC431_08660 [Salmonella enterica subsp. enterica serovar Virchow]|nr:hypothetical protein [Salmonella enterica subsp. enterica serovar Virchow]EDH9336374.1 hypothetical protein [Salmonella enterica subsp. enterica serovar Virchow]
MYLAINVSIISEFSVVFFARFFCYEFSKLNVIKRSEKNPTMVYADSDLPSSPPFFTINTFYTRGISFLHPSISKVFSRGHHPQIIYAVIFFVAVDMVNFARRELSMREKPSKPVGFI